MNDVRSRDELMARRERLERAKASSEFYRSLSEDMKPVVHNKADTWQALKVKEAAAPKIIRTVPARRPPTPRVAPTRHPGISGGRLTVAKSPASLSFTAFAPAAGADYMVPAAGAPVHNIGTQRARHASREEGM
ncbi:hypothetical protein [Embleya sp. NPDC001921]